jgi:hypothetical protein
MAFNQRIPLLAGLAALTAVGSAIPAQANVAEMASIEDALSTAEAVEIELSPISIDTSIEMANESIVAESGIEATGESASVAPAVDAEAVGLPDESASTSATLLLDTPQVDGLLRLDEGLLSLDDAGIGSVIESSTVDVAQAGGEEPVDLAQLTRGTYDGISPMYLGAGGNIGIGNRDRSGVASFGFNIISKIGLGPRFALRPSATITNQSTSFVVPITYNFNTFEMWDVRMQPYVGTGVDIPTGSNIGWLIDAGVDIPISRDFTINAVSNWRITSGFGLGISLGVGYNFPFIFE